MEKMFLTNGGNLLRFHSDKYYFQKPNGEFIREVSNSEAEYLIEVCHNISLQQELPHPEFLPTWDFLKSIRVMDDYSNYRAETSCNGGDYSFHTYHDWYAAKYPDGSWKYAFVKRHTTSAEFSYTELGGYFESHPGYCYITNVKDNVKYTMGCASHDDVLERIATMSSFEDMWDEQYEFIPSRWDEEDEGYEEKALSFTDKKEIITRLKELGVTKPSFRMKRRGGKRR